VLFAVEKHPQIIEKGKKAGQTQNRAGLMTAQVAETLDFATIREFAPRLGPTATVHTDAFRSLQAFQERNEHEARVTPPHPVQHWLPLVHRVISNFKRFILGTFHGVSKTDLHEYLQEFVYRFNRRRWEKQLPRRLLQAAVDHAPVHLC